MTLIKLVSSIIYHLGLIMANGDNLSHTNVDTLHRIRGMVTDICDESGIDRYEEA